MYDLGSRIVLAARAIDHATSDRDVDDRADRLEAELAAARIARRSWIRELLFCLRNLPLDGRFHVPYLASVEVARASGAVSVRAAEVLRELAANRLVTARD